MDNFQMYDAQADNINVDDITASSYNRIVLRRIKRNDANTNSLCIRNHHNNVGEDYCPEGVYDMGWLGFFVGKNDHLQELILKPFTPTSASVRERDVIVPFLRGVKNNKSIQEIGFYRVDMLEGELFTMLGSFFKNNHNLIKITIKNCVWGDEGRRLFALAIGNCTHRSLQKIELENNSIAEEEMVDIITALSMHPNLDKLDLDGNHLRKNGCVALATLLLCSATELQNLYLSNNDIGDEGIEALVPALTTCSHLKQLHLCDSPLITTRGWQRFATILEASNSNLEELYIYRNNVDDDAVASFASALTNNNMLYKLDLDDNLSITAVGWQALSNPLCNTSSVNATFLSNHTLWYVGANENTNDVNFIRLLKLNQRTNKKKVAMIKILQTHDDVDVLPFFEWEFKVLPMVLRWLERASSFRMPRGFQPNIDRRKLSTIYQFVRAMPVLFVETRLRKELEDIKVAESQLEEEEESQEDFMQRKQLLQERKESIMKRLGGKSLQTR